LSTEFRQSGPSQHAKGGANHAASVSGKPAKERSLAFAEVAALKKKRGALAKPQSRQPEIRKSRISSVNWFEKWSCSRDPLAALRLRVTFSGLLGGETGIGFQFTNTRDAGRSIAESGYVPIRMAWSDHFSTQDLASLSVPG
jgi:hypothetical protein